MTNFFILYLSPNGNLMVIHNNIPYIIKINGIYQFIKGYDFLVFLGSSMHKCLLGMEIA